MKRRLPRLPALPPRALRERLGPVLLAAVYLLATHFPLGVAYAAPGVFFQQGAGATRLPLEVSSFDAPGFGEIEDAINLATGSLYLGTDALSNNSTLEAGDEQQGKFSGNWNFSQKLRLYGYTQTLLVAAAPPPAPSSLQGLAGTAQPATALPTRVPAAGAVSHRVVSSGAVSPRLPAAGAVPPRVVSSGAAMRSSLQTRPLGFGSVVKAALPSTQPGNAPRLPLERPRRLDLPSGGGLTALPTALPTALFIAQVKGMNVLVTNLSSDPDGDLQSYTWTWGDGQSTTTTSKNYLAHTYAALGTYTITLTARDAAGGSHQASQTVTISSANGANTRPTASFTSSSSALTLNVFSTSTDPNFDPLTYSWAWGDGTPNSSGSPSSHTYAAAGTYTVTLTATDGRGGTHSASQSVTVNRLPTAAFTLTVNNLTVTPSNTSSDPDGDALTYVWDWGDNSPQSTGTAPTHVYAAAGTYTVFLKATDSRGGVAPWTQRSVTVTAPTGPNRIPTAAFTATVNNFTVSVNSTSSDPDGDPLSYIWDWGNGSQSVGASPAPKTYNQAMGYTITLTVTDGKGGTHSTTRDIVTQDPNANRPPTVSFTASVSGATVTTVPTVSDPDGDLLSMIWKWGDGIETGEFGAASHTYTANATYTIILSVNDGHGNTTTATRYVTISSTPTNAPPVAAFTLAASGLTVTPTNTSSDPNGDPLTYTWTWGDTTTSSGLNPSHTYATASTYTVKLDVSDGRGGTNSTTRNVTVSSTPVNTPPVAAFTLAASGLTVTPTNTSSDPNGDPLTYTWTWGDTTTSSGLNPSHTYATAGTYTVKLDVSDGRGGTNSTTRNVTVSSASGTPSTLTLGLGDGATMQFSQVDRSTLTNTDTDAGVPDWIYQYKSTPNTALYRLNAKAGRSYAGDWIVLTRRSSGQTVAHYYSSGGSRTTFYGDGEWADFTQNLYEQNSNPVGDPDGIDSKVKTQITYEAQGLSSGRISSVRDRWGRQTDYKYKVDSPELVERIDYLKQGTSTNYARSVTFDYNGTQLTGVNYLASTGVNANFTVRPFTFDYDGQGRIKSTTRYIGNNKVLTTTYSYRDPSNLDTNKVQKVTQMVGTLEYEPEMTYTYSGNTVTVTQGADADKKTTVYTYDTLTSTLTTMAVTDHSPMRAQDRPLTTQYTYDTNGSIGTVTSPSGKLTRYTYDARGNPKVVRESWNAGADYRQTETAYDHNNRPKSVTPSASSVVAAPKTTHIYSVVGPGAVTEITTQVQGGSTDPALASTLNHTTVTTVGATNGLPSRSKKSWDGASQSVETLFTYATLGSQDHILMDLNADGTMSSTPRTAWQYGDQVAKQVTRATGAAEVELSYVYDRIGQPVVETQTNAFWASGAPALSFSPVVRGRTVRRGFDGFGNLTWEQTADSSGVVTDERWTRYYMGGAVEVSWSGKATNKTTYSYDTKGRLAGITPLHGARTLTYDLYGRVLTQTEAGFVTSFMYDTLDREVKRTLPDDSAVVTQYGISGAVEWSQDTPITPTLTPEASPATPTKTVTNQLDPLGRVTQSTVQGGGTSYVVETTYDAFDHPTKVVNGALGMLGTAAARTTHLAYDGAGLLVRTLQPELGPDGAGTRAARPFALYGYDGAGNQTTEQRLLTGADVTTDTWVTTTPGTAGTTWATTTSVLNALGKPLSVKNPRGYTSTLEYDASGNLIRQKPQDTAATVFAYDASGRQTALVDARGNPFYTRYDVMGNVTEKWEARCTDTTCASASSKKLVQRYGYTYTADGLLQETNEPAMSGSGTLINTEFRSYTDAGRALPTTISRLVANIWVPSTPTYDAAGRVVNNTLAGDKGTPLEQRYDGHGNVVYTKTPEGFVTTTGYDAFDRMVSKKEWARPGNSADLKVNGGNGLSSSYTYDAAGNLKRKLERGMVTNYGYNSLGKVVLEKQTIQEGSEGSAKTQNTHTYRLDGAKLSTLTIGGNLTTFAYDVGGVLELENSTDSGVLHHQSVYTNNERGQHLSRDFKGHILYYPEQYGPYGQTVFKSNYSTYWQYDDGGNLSCKWDVPGNPNEDTALFTTRPVCAPNIASTFRDYYGYKNLYYYEYSPTGKELYHYRNVQVRQKSKVTNNLLWRSGGNNGILLAATVGYANTLYNDRDLIASSSVLDKTPKVGTPKPAWGYDDTSPMSDRHSALGSYKQTDTSYTYYIGGAKRTTTVTQDGAPSRTTEVVTYDVRGRPTLERDPAGNTVTSEYLDDGTATKTVRNASGGQLYRQTDQVSVGGLTVYHSDTQQATLESRRVPGDTHTYNARGQLVWTQYKGCKAPDSSGGDSLPITWCYLGQENATGIISRSYTPTGKPQGVSNEFRRDAQDDTFYITGTSYTYRSSDDFNVQEVTRSTYLSQSRIEISSSTVSDATYTLDTLGNRIGVTGGTYDGYTKRYDAEGRVSEFDQTVYGRGVFCRGQTCNSATVSQINAFQYDPQGNQTIASETSLIEVTDDTRLYTVARRFNNSVYANNELQVIHRKEGAWSWRPYCSGLGGCRGYAEAFGGTYESGGIWAGQYEPEIEHYNNSELFKDQTYTLAQGYNDATDFSGKTTFLFNVKPSSDDKDLKPSEPATSTQIGVSIVDAGTPSSAQTPTDGSKEQAAAPSSDAKTPEIGATVQGNGDLRPRDDSAAHAASSVASSAAQAASSGGGDATSSVLGGTLDVSKVAGAEGASSTTPTVPVENAQAPSSSTGIPSITTPQDAKPGGSSGVNLPQIGVNGLEGAKAPVGFVEQASTPRAALDVQAQWTFLDGIADWIRAEDIKSKQRLEEEQQRLKLEGDKVANRLDEAATKAFQAGAATQDVKYAIEDIRKFTREWPQDRRLEFLKDLESGLLQGKIKQQDFVELGKLAFVGKHLFDRKDDQDNEMYNDMRRAVQLAVDGQANLSLMLDEMATTLMEQGFAGGGRSRTTGTKWKLNFRITKDFKDKFNSGAFTNGQKPDRWTQSSFDRAEAIQFVSDRYDDDEDREPSPEERYRLAVQNTRSSIHRNDNLVKEANKLSGTEQEAAANLLVEQYLRGNRSPGIGNNPDLGIPRVFELRARNGARVYVRETSNGGLEILAKSTKGNQQYVINQLIKTYGEK